MNDIPYKKEINPKTKARVVVIALIWSVSGYTSSNTYFSRYCI